MGTGAAERQRGAPPAESRKGARGPQRDLSVLLAVVDLLGGSRLAAEVVVGVDIEAQANNPVRLPWASAI